jgi:hypothetical protein
MIALHSRGETAWRWPVDATQQPRRTLRDRAHTVHRCVRRAGLQAAHPGRRHQQFGEIGPQQLSAFDFALGRDQGFARLRWLVESGE